MKKYLISSVLILWIIFAASSVRAGEYINTTKIKTANYYAWITTLSIGERLWTNISEEDSERLGGKVIAARQFRVAITTSEIYNNVYFEEITEGPEGCCRKIVKVRELNLDDMKNKFQLRGELAGFVVINWTSPTSFRFKFKDRIFELTALDKQRVYIEEKTQ